MHALGLQDLLLLLYLVSHSFLLDVLLLRLLLDQTAVCTDHVCTSTAFQDVVRSGHLLLLLLVVVLELLSVLLTTSSAYSVEAIIVCVSHLHVHLLLVLVATTVAVIFECLLIV